MNKKELRSQSRKTIALTLFWFNFFWGLQALGAEPVAEKSRLSREIIIEQLKLYYHSQTEAKIDQINLKLNLEKADLNIMAFTKTNLPFNVVLPIMQEPEKYREWVLNRINERPAGGKYFLEVHDIQIDLAKQIMDVACLFQVLFLKFSDTAQYEFEFETFKQGFDVAIKLIVKNQIVTEMTGNFMALKSSVLDSQIQDGKTVFILFGQARFLRVIAAMLPMGWIQEELSERLDRMTQNLYLRAGIKQTQNM